MPADGVFIVLDQSVLRRRSDIESLCANPSTRLVVPDVVLIEPLKSKDWESQIVEHALGLAPCVDRIHAARYVGEAIKTERESGALPTRHSLIPSDHTQAFRKLILSLAQDRGALARDRVLRDIERERDDLLRTHAEAEREKQTLDRSGNALEADLVRNGRALPASSEDRGAILDLVTGILLEQMHSVFPAGVPSAVRKQPWRSVAIRLALLRVRRTVDRAVRLRIDRQKLSNKPSLILNEVLDEEYVLIASYCDGLSSNDGRQRRVLEELNAALARVKQRHARSGAPVTS